MVLQGYWGSVQADVWEEVIGLAPTLHVTRQFEADYLDTSGFEEAMKMEILGWFNDAEHLLDEERLVKCKNVRVWKIPLGKEEQELGMKLVREFNGKRFWNNVLLFFPLLETRRKKKRIWFLWWNKRSKKTTSHWQEQEEDVIINNKKVEAVEEVTKTMEMKDRRRTKDIEEQAQTPRLRRMVLMWKRTIRQLRQDPESR